MVPLPTLAAPAIPPPGTALPRTAGHQAQLEADTRPAGMAPATWRGHLNTLRHQAGPQLLHTSPPWVRPGPRGGNQHRPPWPGRDDNWSIPIPLAVNGVPDVETRQDGLNAALAGLAAAYTRNPATHPYATPVPSAIERASDGPLVFARQVAARHAADRQGAFPWRWAPDHSQRMYDPGQLSPPALAPVMPLADYAACITDAVRDIRLTQGTLFSVASEQPSQAAALAAQSSNVHFVQAVQAIAGAGVVARPVGLGSRSSLWHAAGVFIQSHTHYPRHIPEWAHTYANPWQHYTFDGVFRECYVYDPSYINEAVPQQPASASLATHGHSRIGSHQMLSVVQRLLWGQGPTGLGQAGGRARWLSHQGTRPRIGGGGNIGGIDECQRMTVVWMCQVAWLTRELSRAIWQFSRGPSQQTLQAFLRAEREWRDFFADYTELRP